MGGQTRKIGIVTGGSRGLGRSTVLALARRGVASIFTYHTNSAEADKVVATVRDGGGEAVALKLDTGNVAEFDGFIADDLKPALARLGAERFDYLVNNAGNSHKHSRFTDQTEDEFDALFKVHFKGVYFLTQKLLSSINDGGRIVLVSTGTARFTVPGSSAYSCMKGGIEVLARYLAKELGPRGIACNTVAPGAIATDFSGGQTRDNPERAQMIKNATALGRVGQPEDIGPVIASLLSDENGWINAQRIEASGGMFL